MHQTCALGERQMAQETGGQVRDLVTTLIAIAVLDLAVGVWAYVWVPPLS